MYLLAHIAGIPVQEWSPFIVPVVVLYLYGRRSTRKRQAALREVGDRASSLEESTAQRILSAWSKAGHDQLTSEHVRLLYPPGVDGANVAEIAARLGSKPDAVQTSLEVLAELGYVDLEDDADGAAEGPVWLTPDGFNLVHSMEDLLLDRVKTAEASG